MPSKIHPVISDIFFHMEHEERNLMLAKSARNGTDVDLNEERQAILRDAHQMSVWLKRLDGFS